jgi:hypothetical protein
MFPSTKKKWFLLVAMYSLTVSEHNAVIVKKKYNRKADKSENCPNQQHCQA